MGLSATLPADRCSDERVIYLPCIVGNVINVLNYPLSGAIIGAAGAIVGGFLGAWFIAWRDSARRVVEHKAAVRAVLHELAGNLATLRTVQAKGSPNELAVVYSAYNSLLVPLFSEQLPERTASHLGKAYGRLMLVDRVAPTSRWDVFLAGEDDYLTAQKELMAYAKNGLRLKF